MKVQAWKRFARRPPALKRNEGRTLTRVVGSAGAFAPSVLAALSSGGIEIPEPGLVLALVGALSSGSVLVSAAGRAAPSSTAPPGKPMNEISS